jgi:hypothetical protein
MHGPLQPGAFVRQGEKGGDGLHLVCRQLLQHLLVMDSLTESHDDRCIGDMWNGSTYLGEAGNEGLESFAGLLPHGMEVGLHTMLLVRAGEVHHELCAELSPGLDGSWREVHEPSLGWLGQGYMKVTCHDSIVTTRRRDGGDVDLQEFRRVGGPVILFWQVCDEDITPMDIQEVPPLDIQTIQGPITRARARQLNLEVSSLLSVSINNCENGLLPNFYNMIRNQGEV